MQQFLQQIAPAPGANWMCLPVQRLPDAPPDAPQRWYISFSGVAIVNLSGSQQGSWRRETVLLEPDFRPPIDTVIQPPLFLPPDPPNAPYGYRFADLNIGQWAGFASPTSVRDDDADNGGWAVDAARVAINTGGTDAFGNPVQTCSGLFLDLAVRDSDVTLFRIAYHMELLVISLIYLVQPG